MVGGCVVRLVSRIPAARGRVAQITVHLRYDGTETSPGVDVTDVQLQPGAPSGVVPHPSDLRLRTGGARWRNGVIPRSTDEVIILSDDDRAAPTRIDVRPAGAGNVRVGSFRFGQLTGPGHADGETLTASQGWGRVPVITERSDGHVPVTADRPVHLTVAWSERT